MKEPVDHILRPSLDLYIHGGKASAAQCFEGNSAYTATHKSNPIAVCIAILKARQPKPNGEGGMTEMLEKMARGIAEEDGKRFAGKSLYDHNPELFERLARAGLLAIREPSARMLAFGYETQGSEPDDELMLIDAWPAMIDAILADGDRG